MSVSTTKFNHVSYLWDEKKAAELAGDEVALLIYRSNLLGADLRLTNFGGGNTSCKVMSKDPLTGKQTEVMWVKGSGGDIGTLKKSGLAALYMDRLLSLKNVYRGLEHEDEMVELFTHSFRLPISTTCTPMQLSQLQLRKMVRRSHKNCSTERSVGLNGNVPVL